MNWGKGAMEYSLFVAGQNRNTFPASEFGNFISIFKTNFVAKAKHFAFMDKQSYPFREIKNELLFEFDSISESQTIRKVISYQRIDTKRNIFNLALLDLDDDGNMSEWYLTMLTWKSISHSNTNATFIFWKSWECKSIFHWKYTSKNKVISYDYFKVFRRI